MPELLEQIMRDRSPSNEQAATHLDTLASGHARGDQDKFDSVQAFIDRVGGDVPIRKVLIANNGIGAVKCIRSIRKWSFGLFGDERKIHFVVMATPEDMNANAEYIRMADEIVEVPNGTNNRNYANVVLIVNIAEQHECDAVWAGWGHASENPALPNALEAVASRRIVFIGPPAGPMGALGDKIGSTIIAQSAGVPTIAWNGDGLTASYATHGRIPQEVYDRANVTSVQQAVETCAKVGFPLMIKASEGGGGKGIRKVLRPEDVELCFHQVQGEIPGSPIFIMKLAPDARHLEVQLLADRYGEAIALSGRDCSVQRRHQKIIEEGPPLAPTPEVWAQMQAAAVRLAKEVGYVNAGTVEYLFMPDGSFAFLELNPRLQVEHPVTEMITGVNLPACQLMVAMGVPLGRIPQIRTLYGYEPFGDDAVVFQKPEAEGGELVACAVQGHVIACRITAENPDQGFQPTSGAIQELNFRSTRNVWGYFSVDSSGQVHEYADSQIGHLFAWGATRELARESMVQALKECSIRGEIQTTVEYLIDVLQTPEFSDYEVNTAWLDKRIEGNVRVNRGNHLQLAILTAAVQAFRRCEGARKSFIDFLQRGQIPPSSLLNLKSPVTLIYEGIKYGFQTYLMGANTVVVAINGTATEVRIRRLSDGGLLLVLGARSHTVYAKDVSAGLRMTIDGKTCLFPKEYDPSHLRAEMAGKLTRFLAADGATVAAGDPYAEVEVMKMFLSLKAPEDGVLRHAVTDGCVLSDGDLVARLELTDPSKVKTSSPFEGRIPAAWTMRPYGRGTHRGAHVKPHAILRELVRGTLDDVAAGFEVPRVRVDAALRALPDLLSDPQLPFSEFQEALSFFSGRLPPALEASLTDLLSQVATSCTAAAGATHAGTNGATIVVEEVDASQLPGGSVSESCNAFALAFPEGPDDEVPPSWRLVARIPVLIHDGKRAHLASLPEGERARAGAALDQALEPLLALADRYAHGFRQRLFLELAPVLQRYIEVEQVYNQHNFQVEDAIRAIRSQHPDNLEAVHDVALSHARLISKNHLVLKTLALIPLVASPTTTASWTDGSGRGGSAAAAATAATAAATAAAAADVGPRGPHQADAEFMRMLEQLTLLDTGSEYKAVALAARQKLISSQLPSMKRLREHIVECLRGGSDMGSAAVLDSQRAVNASPYGAALKNIEWLMDNNTDDLMEVLLDLSSAPTEADLRTFQAAADSQHQHQQPPTQQFADADEARAALRRIALEVYALRVYRSYGVREVGQLDLSRNREAAAGLGTSALLHLRGDVNEFTGQRFGASSFRGTTGNQQHSPSGSPHRYNPAAESSSMMRATSNTNLAHLGQLANTTHGHGGSLGGGGTTASGGSGSGRGRSGSMDESESSSDIHAALFLSVQTLRGLGSIVAILDALQTTLRLGSAAAGGGGARDRHPVASRAVGGISGNPFGGRLGAPRGSVGHLTGTGGVGGGGGARNPVGLLKGALPQSVLHVLMPPARELYEGAKVPDTSDTELSRQLHTFVCTISEQLRAANIRRVTFVQSGGSAAAAAGAPVFTSVDMRAVQPSKLFTFRNTLDFREDQLLRHIEPPMAHHLELHRLSNYSIHMLDTSNRVVRAYRATPKPAGGNGSSGGGDAKAGGPSAFFVRVLVRRLEVREVAVVAAGNADTPGAEAVAGAGVADAAAGAAGAAASSSSSSSSASSSSSPSPATANTVTTIVGAERYLLEAMNALENPVATTRAGPGHSSHIFLNVLSPIRINATAVASVVRRLFSRFQARLARLRVMQVEVRMRIQAATPSGAAAEGSGGGGGLAGVASDGKGPVTLRMVAENPTGFNLRVDAYVEQESAQQGAHRGKLVLHSISNFADKGALDGLPVDTPYPVAQPIQQKRAFAALASSTCYVYDFIDLLECALREHIWRGHSNPPHKVMDATELVLGDDGRLWEVSRPIGQNTIGMVAWIVKLYTPQFPPRTGGREVVIVANDITVLVGSFGTREDLLFQKVTAYARRRGVPRLYFAANSGARIGLAKEVKECFKVAWLNPADPTKGFKYLYVTPDDYERLAAEGAIIAERVVVDSSSSSTTSTASTTASGDSTAAGGGGAAKADSADTTAAQEDTSDAGAAVVVGGRGGGGGGRASSASNVSQDAGPEIHYRITTIIGKDRDLGVENLQGSGAIAGESARAYNDIFTMTYVCGRSVGIGAYLVRLNQRTIQRRTMAPIILTGYAALNKLVGRSVYTSNAQLGGPGIMYTNGVSHLTVGNDLEGMVEVLRWLSFVPRCVGAPLPVLETSDHVDRPVQVVLPTDEAYDPRVLLNGHARGTTVVTAAAAADASVGAGAGTGGESSPRTGAAPRQWVAGFCDRGSFVETLGGWAKTVVTGRARLGGIPIGVVATENRTVSKTVPADPASPESGESTTTQPGGVWFPDSAAKTAQAIRDLNTEGLPLFIFANWRGFSGGQRDMYDEVLKFGADIVTALVDYSQPVFVYIPPEAQLRGGAWVVVDSTINPRVMEMYAAPTARGGVLEPAGAVSIKFRPKDVKLAAHRIDPKLVALRHQGASAPKGSKEAEDAASQIFAREELVSSIYQQVALKFASLHDTPGRMLTKGVIHGIVPLRRARLFFFWRLRRKLRQFDLVREIRRVDPSLAWDAAEDTLREWFLDAHRDTYHHQQQHNSHHQHSSHQGLHGGDSDGASAGGGDSGSGGSGGGMVGANEDRVVHSMDQTASGHVRGLDLGESLWATGDEYVAGWFERQAHAIARHIGVLRYKYIVAQVQHLGLSAGGPHDPHGHGIGHHHAGHHHSGHGGHGSHGGHGGHGGAGGFEAGEVIECGGEGAAQAVVEGVLALVQSLPDEERGRAIARLRRDIVFMDLPSNTDAPTGALRPLDPAPDSRAYGRQYFQL